MARKKLKPLRLLSVDWDYFFPNPLLADKAEDPTVMLYDWGHREAPFFIVHVWDDRAAGFVRNKLPLPSTSGEEKTFWSRFRFAKGARLWYAESHSFMVYKQDWGRAAEIWNFDAHHDAGYGDGDASFERLRQGVIHCDDWLMWYLLVGAKAEVVYPRWHDKALQIDGLSKLLTKLQASSVSTAVQLNRRIDDGSPVEVEFDDVFVCRSGAWVPPWLDARFHEFIRACPLPRNQLQHLPERQYNPERVQEIVGILEQLHKPKGEQNAEPR